MRLPSLAPGVEVIAFHDGDSATSLAIGTSSAGCRFTKVAEFARAQRARRIVLVDLVKTMRGEHLVPARRFVLFEDRQDRTARQRQIAIIGGRRDTGPIENRRRDIDPAHHRPIRSNSFVQAAPF